MRAPAGDAYAKTFLDPNFVYEKVPPTSIGPRGARWVAPWETEEASCPATRSSAAAASGRSRAADPEPAMEPMRSSAAAAARRSRIVDISAGVGSGLTSTSQRLGLVCLQACHIRSLATNAGYASRDVVVRLPDAPTLKSYADLGYVDGRDVRVQELLLATPGMQELLQRAAHMVFAIQTASGRALCESPWKAATAFIALCFRGAPACAWLPA